MRFFTHHWCCDKLPDATHRSSLRTRQADATEEFCRDREFSITTDFLVFSAAIEISLSQQTFQGLLSRQRFLCCDRVCPALCHDRVSCIEIGPGAGTAEARAIAACAQVCTRRTYDSALCRTLFGSLFMGTVKKKTKPPRNWGVTKSLLETI